MTAAGIALLVVCGLGGVIFAGLRIVILPGVGVGGFVVFVFVVGDVVVVVGVGGTEAAPEAVLVAWVEGPGFVIGGGFFAGGFGFFADLGFAESEVVALALFAVGAGLGLLEGGEV